MGIGIFSNRRSELYSEPNAAPASMPTVPNPYIYQIFSQEVIGNYSIVEARYAGCTTFSGRKLMLIKGNREITPPLDPHLLGDGHSVIARFEPNEQGRRMARLCALYLTEVLDNGI